MEPLLALEREVIQEALLIVNKLFAEKHTEVFEFEKQAPDHIQELNNMIKGDA